MIASLLCEEWDLAQLIEHLLEVLQSQDFFAGPIVLFSVPTSVSSHNWCNKGHSIYKRSLVVEKSSPQSGGNGFLPDCVISNHMSHINVTVNKMCCVLC